MKRKNNLYKNICNIDNIISTYKEVSKNTRNERRVFNMKQYKAIYIARVYNAVTNKTYKPGKYNKFIIYEPKERVIVSQSIHDKIINHLVARYILYPAILPCLLDINVASRKNMGTSAGIKYELEFIRKCKVKYIRYRNTKRKIRAKYYLYKTKRINLISFASSLMCYENLQNMLLFSRLN